MTKTILITGANRGIGLELVKQYAEDDWTVVACCRSPGSASELQSLRNKNTTVLIKTLDLNNPSSIQTLASELTQTIDVLINNAGIYVNEADNPYDTKPWHDSFQINTISPYLLTRALLKNGLNTVANMSSGMGSIEMNHEGGYPVYRASKVALNAITKTLSVELRPKKIIVVSLDPGWVKTDMGGNNAPLSVHDSVAGIRNVLAKLQLEDSGHFFKYNGQPLPW